MIEVDAALKRQIYTVLATRGTTLKDWFTEQARELVEEHRQPSFLHKTTFINGRQQ